MHNQHSDPTSPAPANRRFPAEHSSWLLALTLTVAACGGAGSSASPQTGADNTRKSGAGDAGSPQPTAAGDAMRTPTGPNQTAEAKPIPAGAGSEALDAGAASGFDAGTAPDRNRVAPGGLCERAATLQCAGEVQCCMTARSFQACKTARLMECTATYLDDVARQTVTGYDVAQTERVLSQIEALSARCDPSVKPWFNGPEGLRSFFKGTIAADQPCPPPAGLPALAGYAAALASCKDPSTHACLFSGLGPPTPPRTSKCTTRGSAGAACFGDLNCEDAFYCDNAAMTYSGGSCMARKALGAACLHSVECSSGFCNHSDAVCGPANVQQAYCN